MYEVPDAVPPIHAVSSHVATDKDPSKFRSIFSDNLQPIATRGKIARGTLLVDFGCSSERAPPPLVITTKLVAAIYGGAANNKYKYSIQYCPCGHNQSAGRRRKNDVGARYSLTVNRTCNLATPINTHLSHFPRDFELLGRQVLDMWHSSRYECSYSSRLRPAEHQL